MKGPFSLLALALMVGVRVAWADCGSIPFKPWVSVFEPNQRAVIAYNGHQEILLLSTDLRASEPTKVLEVIPFPSEPKVAKGDVNVFYQGTELINQKLFPTRRGEAAMGGLGMGGGAPGKAAPPPPAGRVTAHKKIGAHDISVALVLDRRRFVGWVEDYLRKEGVDNPTVPTPLKEVVEEYLQDGFKWFAFDVVELGEETVTKDAIQYRFKTRFLYYPLRITRTEKGATRVRLLLISPRLVRIPDLRSAKARLMHKPVTITRDELRYLDKDMHGLLNNPLNLLRIWEINGKLSGFKRDVVTTWY